MNRSLVPAPAPQSAADYYENAVMLDFFAKACPDCGAKNELAAATCSECDRQIEAVRTQIQAIVERS